MITDQEIILELIRRNVELQRKIVEFENSEKHLHDVLTNNGVDNWDKYVDRLSLLDRITLLIEERDSLQAALEKKEKEHAVDLRTCKPGDLLVSKHGEVLTYEGPSPYGNTVYPHYVKYPNGGFGTRSDGGFVSIKKPLPTDHDIVYIIRKNAK